MWLPRLLRRNQPCVLLHDTRVYAIGDIHGRLDLLSRLVRQIEHDSGNAGHQAYRVVILGDFIDRGPGSKKIIELFKRLSREENFHVLQGNHEAIMVDAYNGNHDAMSLWLEHGGLATLASLGVDITTVDTSDTLTLLRSFREVCPASMITWLASLPRSVQIGRYTFVHAGIRPGVDLDKQQANDQLWIREEFTESDADHGAIIVHGHTIYEDGVCFRKNRIGVDTGAYRTNRLSAVALEGNQAWALTTGLPKTSYRSIWVVPD